MNQPGTQDSVSRAAANLVQALTEWQQAGAGAGEALERLVQRFEGQLGEDREQRRALAGQLTSLAGALDRLVSHLQGLSQLMADVLERMAEPPPAPASHTQEASFLPGGEGVTVALVAVPGFQALMDIQKALISLGEVAGASVERFQEAESRILLQLSALITATEIATAIHGATGHAAAIEEARPEALSLCLKIVPAN